MWSIDDAGAVNWVSIPPLLSVRVNPSGSHISGADVVNSWAGELEPEAARPIDEAVRPIDDCSWAV